MPVSSSQSKPGNPPELFRRAFVGGLTGWTLLTIAMAAVETAWKVTILWAAIPSLLIAGLALAPGMMLPSRERLKGHGDRAMSFLIGVTAAMVIRIVGTVALVAVCRYHFGESADRMTLWVCFFYVVLTSFEVIVLARGGRRLDPPRLAESPRLSA